MIPDMESNKKLSPIVTESFNKYHLIILLTLILKI